jgi:MoxR-like ATPase
MALRLDEAVRRAPSTRMVIQQPDLDRIAALRRSIESVIIGKGWTVKLVVTSLLARGHLLIEDIPGVGKTALARALARSIDCQFRRITFTPDLLPGDVTGVTVFDQEKRAFAFKPGPVFTNVLLADEINRATPRTQSALLEAMNEARVSADGVTHTLPVPFLVVATQNPLEFTGTYPLPESQLDRFLMVLKMGYPSAEEEAQILLSRRAGDPVDRLQPAVSHQDVASLCDKVQDVRVDGALTKYIVGISDATRNEKSFLAGVSPRGSTHLFRAAQAYAMVEGRDYVTPDDVKAVAVSVLSHRVIERRTRASADGRATVHTALKKILQDVPVPQ